VLFGISRNERTLLMNGRTGLVVQIAGSVRVQWSLSRLDFVANSRQGKSRTDVWKAQQDAK
jgi:hypothetical protein